MSDCSQVRPPRSCRRPSRSASSPADAAAQTAAPLTLQVYNADASSFHVNAVLVSGKTDAVLLDTGFTRADALRIAAMVLDSKKTLKTIYISQADPDYYFGIEVLKQHFPDAKVLATAPTLKKIQATLATKLQVWGPRMGANAPKNVPLPDSAGRQHAHARRPDARDPRPRRHPAAPQLRVDPVDQGDRRRRQRVRRLAPVDRRHAERRRSAPTGRRSSATMAALQPGDRDPGPLRCRARSRTPRRSPTARPTWRASRRTAARPPTAPR